MGDPWVLVLQSLRSPLNEFRTIQALQYCVSTAPECPAQWAVEIQSRLEECHALAENHDLKSLTTQALALIRRVCQPKGKRTLMNARDLDDDDMRERALA